MHLQISTPRVTTKEGAGGGGAASECKKWCVLCLRVYRPWQSRPTMLQIQWVCSSYKRDSEVRITFDAHKLLCFEHAPHTTACRQVQWRGCAFLRKGGCGAHHGSKLTACVHYGSYHTPGPIFQSSVTPQRVDFNIKRHVFGQLLTTSLFSSHDLLGTDNFSWCGVIELWKSTEGGVVSYVYASTYVAYGRVLMR